MKNRRIFFSGLILAIILLFFSAPAFIYGKAPAEQMYYEVKIYRLKDPGKAEVFDKYLKDAFIPAMHRAGVPTVGVFKPVEADTAYGKMIYVFIPYKTADQYFKIVSVLENDPVYQQAGKEFLDAPWDNPPFSRYESIFLKAFAFMPQFRVPSFSTPKSERIYELRSYESWTDAKAMKKIEMFNEGGEIGIFEKVGSNAVFYGQVLLGSQKPRLMYMTTYADMNSQKEHWAAFGKHPDWIALKAKEEYQHTVIKPKPYLLHPTEYSDF